MESMKSICKVVKCIQLHSTTYIHIYEKSMKTYETSMNLYVCFVRVYNISRVSLVFMKESTMSRKIISQKRPI